MTDSDFDFEPIEPIPKRISRRIAKQPIVKVEEEEEEEEDEEEEKKEEHGWAYWVGTIIGWTVIVILGLAAVLLLLPVLAFIVLLPAMLAASSTQPNTAPKDGRLNPNASSSVCRSCGSPCNDGFQKCSFCGQST